MVKVIEVQLVITSIVISAATTQISSNECYSIYFFSSEILKYCQFIIKWLVFVILQLCTDSEHWKEKKQFMIYTELYNKRDTIVSLSLKK